MSDIVERLREKNEWTNQRPYFHAHDKCIEAASEIVRLRAELAEARAKAFEEAAKVAEQLGGDRIERNPDGTLRTYDMNCKHERGSATLNAMRVRAHTIAQAIRAMIDKEATMEGVGG